jgi:hypothetical protein
MDNKYLSAAEVGGCWGRPHWLLAATAVQGSPEEAAGRQPRRAVWSHVKLQAREAAAATLTDPIGRRALTGLLPPPAQLKKCEALPTKLQLLGTIARLIREPAKRIAVGVKMVPTKLAIGIKKVRLTPPPPFPPLPLPPLLSSPLPSLLLSPLPSPGQRVEPGSRKAVARHCRAYI